MHQFVGVSLKTRLYLLVLAAFIPVAVLIVYVAEEQKAIETDAILHRTMLLARAAADAENQQVAATGDLLVTLSEACRLLDGPPQRLSALIAALLDSTDGYAAFGILDPGGRLVAGSDAPRLAPSGGNRFLRSDRRRQAAITMEPYHGEHIGDAPVLYFTRPVAGDDQTIAAVVFAALDLNWMNRNMFRQLAQLPDGSRLTLLDETGGMLRYEVGSSRWTVPDALDPMLRNRILGQPAGTVVANDESGHLRIYAFSRLESAFRQHPMSVVLEVPRNVALAASKRIFRRNLVLLATSALIAVLAIWWAADIYILRRVKAMVQASRRLAEGDLQARIGRIGADDELSHLSGVFDEMAASLQMRMEREAQALASLKHSREQLRRLTAYQNEVREQERIRIAREIHDQLGQSLTILKMDLAWMKRNLSSPPPPLTEKIAAMSQVLTEAMECLHAVTAELRPVILDDFGLAAAIEWQAEAFTRHSGIDCRLENDGYEPALPREQATALFRVFQETLTNIMRHANADRVVVRLEKRDGHLFLQVIDNGRGITEAEIDAPDAFGLLGIRERLHPFGGWVHFDGRPDQGTRVTIHLPLPAEGDAP